MKNLLLRIVSTRLAVLIRIPRLLGVDVGRRVVTIAVLDWAVYLGI